MRIAVLVGLVGAILSVGVRAQEQPPAQGPAVQDGKTKIDGEAVAAVDAMMAMYAALRSYSDRCEITLEKAEEWPQEQRDRMTFSGTLAFERPSKFRFEGTTPKGAFLLVNDGTTTRILNPDNAGKWVERPQSSPLNLRGDYSRSNLKLPDGASAPIDGGWEEAGPALMAEGFLFHPDLVRNERDMVVLTQFDKDETVDGVECRVVRIGTDYGTGFTLQSRIWIAKPDGLLRRFERRFGDGKDAAVMVENHSEVRANAQLSPETWAFAAPAAVKPLDRFPDPYPTSSTLSLKIGDSLPVFSQDGINGEAVELNPKSGGVTIVYCFFSPLAVADSASLQRLQTALAQQGLRVIGAAGDAKREWVQALITKNKLDFPVYFNDKVYRNQLARALGVRGWPLVLLFDRDAKLRAIAQRPGDEEFVQALRQQFPDVPEQTITEALVGEPATP